MKTSFVQYHPFRNRRGKPRSACVAGPVLVVVLLLFTYSPARSTTLTPELLTGVWKGQIRSCDSSGCVQWESDLTLTIDAGDPSRGTFYSPEYRTSWPTTVETIGDEVLMNYRETRLVFHLINRSSRPLLEANYDGRWLWYPRHNTLQFYKIANP